MKLKQQKKKNYNTRDNKLNTIIIHSKYFPDSDWLKEHV